MSLKPVKKIAGELLLYFYALQRKNFFSLETRVITVITDSTVGAMMRDNDEFDKDLIKISGNANDFYNAMKYLHDRGFLSYNESQNTGGTLFHNLSLRASGTDIIEGVERGKDERNEFNVTFNIKLADNINIDSLIKNELGSLVKLTKVGLF